MAQQHQVPAAKEPEARPVVSQPSSPLVQEEPSDKPTLQPATSDEPAGEQTTLVLEPLLPSQPEPKLQEERHLQLSGKPQQEEADEENPPDAVDGGHSEEQVEKKLWAAVEETEAGAERGMERVGEEEEDGEGVTGG